ncbi:hypothetical protein CAEBREN_04108 [Caenorhabditis brenneri]|uniref:Sdz-33 F-box domain-containing protein n=1 Tax=Caenorhabditis brenneri TaxID=135651 RepID=G0MG87_CAEBE|nr:hypothetical protein CAEBREN_04108 [Caenorhabditis brenneri]
MLNLKILTSRLLLSLLSRNTKDLVRSLQLKPSSPPVTIGTWGLLLDISCFQVFFDDITRLLIRCWDITISFYKEPQNNMETLEKPEKVWIKVKEGTGVNTRWTEREFPNHLEIREWYEHILYVVNPRQETEMTFAQGCERFDLVVIKTVFGKVDRLSFLFSEPHDYVREVLNTFLPNPKQLRLVQNPYPNGDARLQKLLIQNFDKLDLGDTTSELLNLNELSICNAHHIKFSVNQQFDNINHFLKLWIKGLNNRLRTLTIEQRTHFIPEKILDGIKIIREIPGEEIIVNQEIPAWQYAYRTRAVDIKRYDGTTGTVIMQPTRIFFLVSN